MRSSSIPIALIAAGIGALACGQQTLKPSLVPVGQPIEISGLDTLKAHMRSGELFLFREWRVDTVAGRVRGMGRRYGVMRDNDAPFESDLSVAIDSVALFETNRHGAAFPLGMQGVGVMTTIGAYISAVCLMDPKSCFGSCPTFYVDGDAERVHAEGFSSSVARVLEERDVDALPRAGIVGRRATIHMKNEAWETHMVRGVNLLVATRPQSGRTFMGIDSAFYHTANPTAPARCLSPQGDCLAEIATLDAHERRSLADSQDLAVREVLELTFANHAARPGLVLTARNSLITTFLFYQSMAYAGTNMSRLVADFERKGRAYAESHFGMARLLGPIEVLVLHDSGWRSVGVFGEHGPIASDTKIIPLPTVAGDSLRVRLRMAKGNWRLDWAALADIRETAHATRIRPARVDRHGRRDEEALRRLRDTSAFLVSLPGDDFTLVYDLPERAESLELFLESQGYYYEWQRHEWLAEENVSMAAMVLFNPARALEVLAPEYKKREPYMERMFWESRFNRKGGQHATR